MRESRRDVVTGAAIAVAVVVGLAGAWWGRRVAEPWRGCDGSVFVHVENASSVPAAYEIDIYVGALHLGERECLPDPAVGTLAPGGRAAVSLREVPLVGGGSAHLTDAECIAVTLRLTTGDAALAGDVDMCIPPDGHAEVVVDDETLVWRTGTSNTVWGIDWDDETVRRGWS